MHGQIIGAEAGSMRRKSSMNRLEPVDGDQVLHLGEFRVSRDDHGVFSQGGRHRECIGVGHRKVRFDLRRLKGEGLIARIELKRKDLELPDNFLSQWMAVLSGEPIVHLPQVDDVQEKRGLPPLSLSKKRLYSVRARLILNPGQDGERIEQTSFPHAPDPPFGPLTGLW